MAVPADILSTIFSLPPNSCELSRRASFAPEPHCTSESSEGEARYNPAPQAWSGGRARGYRLDMKAGFHPLPPRTIRGVFSHTALRQPSPLGVRGLELLALSDLPHQVKLNSPLPAALRSFPSRTLRFSTSGHPEALRACYMASWQLPRPDSHRLPSTSTHPGQAAASLHREHRVPAHPNSANDRRISCNSLSVMPLNSAAWFTCDLTYTPTPPCPHRSAESFDKLKTSQARDNASQDAATANFSHN
jgi:hypothetical protein